MIKKRTPQQIADSVAKYDLTGGYKFFPWLWVDRRMHAIGTIGILVFGILCFTTLQQTYDYRFQIGAGFVAFAIFIFLSYWLYRDYKRTQKGIIS